MSKTHEDYSPANVQPFEFEFEDHQEHAMREAMEQRTAKAENGQQFSAVHVNRGASGLLNSPLIVRNLAIFGQSSHVDQQFVASQYAAALPGHEYVAIDLPGHGASDPVTKEQRKAIKKSGDVSSVAGAQVEAVQALSPNAKELIVTGEAVGEHMALEFALEAAKRGIRVKHFIGVDPVGLERRIAPAIAGQYLGNALKSRKEHKKDADDEGEARLESAFKAFEAMAAEHGPTKQATQTANAKAMAKERFVLTYMLHKNPFTHDTGFRKMLDLMVGGYNTDPTQDANLAQVKARLLFGGKSVIGRYDELTDTFNDLAAQSNGRFTRDVWPNDNQDLGLARHQPRVIKYLKDTIEA